MTTERSMIVGAGGHARVVMDALLSISPPSGSAYFVDDDPELRDKVIMDCRIIGPIAFVIHAGCRFHVAIGDNGVRRSIHERLVSIGAMPVSVTHPRAVVSRFCKLGAGAFVAAGSVIAPDSYVGEAVIVNHGSIVDHDCLIGAFCHIAPNATLGGGVRIGSGSLIGADAVVLPGIAIGEGAVIGAGAVVTKDVMARAVVSGVPARQVHK